MPKKLSKKELSRKIVISITRQYAFDHYGQAFKFMREIKGWTQAELAKKAKTKQSGIARLERNGHLPGLSTLLRISKLLGYEMQPPKFACNKCHEGIDTCRCNKKVKGQ